MSNGFAYDNFWSAYLALQYLVLELDFAMWLRSKYDGQSAGTPVSLVKEPEQELNALVDAYLLKHKSELVHRRRKCVRCGFEYSWNCGHKICPREMSPWSQGLSPKQGENLPYDVCRGQLVEVPSITESDEILRERAGFALARSIERPDVSKRHNVSTWIVSDFDLARLSDQDDDIVLPLADVLDHLREMMVHNLSKIHHNTPEIELHLNGRRDLIPKGDTLHDKHVDYMAVRDKVLSGMERLVGLAKNLPEFVDDYKAPRGPLTHYAPLALLASAINDAAGRAPETIQLKNLQDDIKELRNKVQEIDGRSADSNVRSEFDELPPSQQKAYSSYEIAENGMHSPPETDLEAYKWLNDNPEAIEDYELPSFDTWCRYLRAARNKLGQQKHKPRSGRSTGSSIVTQNETGIPRNVTD